MTIDFGLFYYRQGRGVPHDQAYAEMLDQIALAETLGFGECCSPRRRSAHDRRSASYLTGIRDGPLRSTGRISNSRCWLGLSVML